MSTPFIGEIRMFAGNFAPVGWMFCEGQLLPISENEALFNLIGTTYGGDGQTTFALPDLRGRLALHQGQGAGLSNYLIGGAAGTESVALTVAQLPGHHHAVQATSADADRRNPKMALPARPQEPAYATTGPMVPMTTPSLAATGGGQAHTNLQPALCVNFIISLFGIFPSRN